MKDQLNEHYKGKINPYDLRNFAALMNQIISSQVPCASATVPSNIKTFWSYLGSLIDAENYKVSRDFLDEFEALALRCL